MFQLAYEGYQTARRWDYSPNSLGLELATDDFDPIPDGATVDTITDATHLEMSAAATATCRCARRAMLSRSSISSIIYALKVAI